MHPSLKLYVLPPFLALAVVASALMGFLGYQARRDMQTTYVVASQQKSRACVLCHDARHLRLVALR